MLSSAGNGRTAGRVLRAAFNPNHFASLARLGVYKNPLDDFFGRYVLGKGEYPHVCRMNTASGPLDINLHSAFDTFTVAEIYSWRCYPISGKEKVIVDFGANIGISMGYFLANAPESYVYGFEPLATNLQIARANLKPFENRYELSPCAVWNRNGVLKFGVEPTGRYSGVGVAQAETEIEVQCVRAHDAIKQLIEKHGFIDLLKIDIEGAEEQVLADLADDQFRAIRTILIEGEEVPFERLASLGMRSTRFSSGIVRFDWPGRANP